MRIKFLIVPAALFSIVLISCDGNSEVQKESDEMHDSTQVITDSLKVEEEDSEVSYNLPSALQIAYVFRKAGATYNSTLPNSVKSVPNYNSSNYKRATNFGVYSTDLAYCLFNKKHQETKDYLKATKEVGVFLGLNQAFESDNFAQRFEKNISNEDSLVKIVSSIELKTDLLFEQNKQKHVAVLTFVGAWVESLYLANEAYSKEKNKKILTSLLEQLSFSEIVLKALNYHKTSEPEIGALISEIEKIKSGYEAIESVKAANEKNEDFAFDALSVSDDEMKTISQSIQLVRQNIIK
jgi:hypothetical protein